MGFIKGWQYLLKSWYYDSYQEKCAEKTCFRSAGGGSKIRFVKHSRFRKVENGENSIQKMTSPPRKFSKRSIQDRFWLKKPYIILGQPIWKWCQILFLIPCCNPKRLFSDFLDPFLLNIYCTMGKMVLVSFSEGILKV